MSAVSLLPNMQRTYADRLFDFDLHRASLSQPGSAEEFEFLATQGFVKLSAMQEMRQYPVFVSEEWAHVLAWDLFVGRYIYLDGLEKVT